MVHTYGLVHDDRPVDDDDLRRGQPTVHKVFGEAMGVCGDALLTDAFANLRRSSTPLQTPARGDCAARAAPARRGWFWVRSRTSPPRRHHRAGARGALKKTGCLLRRRSRRCSAVHHRTSWLESSVLAAILRWLQARRPARWTGSTEALLAGSDKASDLPTLVGLLGPVGCRALIEDETNKALALLDLEQPDEGVWRR